MQRRFFHIKKADVKLQVKKRSLVIYCSLLWAKRLVCTFPNKNAFDAVHLSVTDLCYETPQDVIMKRDFSATQQRHHTDDPGTNINNPDKVQGPESSVSLNTNQSTILHEPTIAARDGIITN